MKDEEDLPLSMLVLRWVFIIVSACYGVLLVVEKAKEIGLW